MSSISNNNLSDYRSKLKIIPNNQINYININSNTTKSVIDKYLKEAEPNLNCVNQKKQTHSEFLKKKTNHEIPIKNIFVKHNKEQNDIIINKTQSQPVPQKLEQKIQKKDVNIAINMPIFKGQIFYFQVQVLGQNISENYHSIIENLGGSCLKRMTKNVTILATNLKYSKSFEKANQLKIPIVNIGWIKQCLQQSTKISYQQYLVEIEKPDKKVKKQSLKNSNISLTNNLNFQKLIQFIQDKALQDEPINIKVIKQISNAAYVKKTSKQQKQDSPIAKKQQQQTTQLDIKKQRRRSQRILLRQQRQSLSMSNSQINSEQYIKKKKIYSSSPYIKTIFDQLDLKNFLVFTNNIRETEILICKDSNVPIQIQTVYAIFNKIPIVNISWIQQIKKKRQLIPYTQFMIAFNKNKLKQKFHSRIYQVMMKGGEARLAEELLKQLSIKLVIRKNENQISKQPELISKQQLYMKIIKLSRQDKKHKIKEY